MSTFVDDEGGYTTVAVAVALLVSLCLVFGAASAQWVMARSADIQEVADAAALAGENSVAAFSTIATVLDACVLSMGIAGMLTLGCGLVVSAVPGLAPVGARVTRAGASVLDARQRFASSAMSGLSKLETTLPALVLANSAACVAANAGDGVSCGGCAIPFPARSLSDFSSLDDEVDHADLDEASERMREASDRARGAKERADDSRLRGWLADCGSNPYCLRERASALAGLGSVENPDYASPELWNFGVPLSRARSYYARREEIEVPESGDVESVTDSEARSAFYAFSLGQVRLGSYEERGDGTVEIDLPGLPGNTADVRATTLYTACQWPCSDESGVRTLHSTPACPGSRGPSSGLASLADLDAGVVHECPSCRMSIGDLGKVPAASTSIDNGFEHHWRLVVEASRDYEQARNEQAAAESDMRRIGEEGRGSFERAIDQLAVPRPTLCPPGAWGCVAVVVRDAGVSVPTELTSSFLSSGELPAGAAVSAAVLAPDDSTAGNDVLARFFDGTVADGPPDLSGIPRGICAAWGRLLSAYGAGYEGLGDVADDVLDGIDGVSGGTVASWLRGQISEVIRRAGFAPSDLRLRKPVITGTQEVLARAGYDDVAEVRALVESLPSTGSPAEMARALGRDYVDEVGDVTFTVAELPIPGTEVTIPLTIRLSDLGGRP